VRLAVREERWRGLLRLGRAVVNDTEKLRDVRDIWRVHVAR
jgi:hypothetical protein